MRHPDAFGAFFWRTQMSASFNKTAAFALFNRIDDATLGFAEQALALGFASASEMRPVALEWASQKYGVALREGQRGLALDDGAKNYEAAKKAVQRVTAACFPKVDAPAKAASQADPVEKLLKAYAKLTAGEKRSFKAALAKL
jgi:hypothetical protein